MKRKLFSMLFVLVMIITVIPLSAFAENTDANQTESYGDFIGGEQVIRDMIEKCGMNTHPRIIMTDHGCCIIAEVAAYGSGYRTERLESGGLQRGQPTRCP